MEILLFFNPICLLCVVVDVLNASIWLAGDLNEFILEIGLIFREI